MKVIRHLAEKWSRNKIFLRKIRVIGKDFPIYISPDAQLKYLKTGSAAFDKDLISIAENFLSESSKVWDIGANVGVFSIASAAIANRGTVIAVEADTWLAGLIRKTIILPPYLDRDIRVIPVAISEKNGIAVFHIAKRGRASNCLEVAGGHSQMGGIREKHYVPCLTLDKLREDLPSPDFIKIDVEGAEVMVLKSAISLLEEANAIIYVEVGSGNIQSVTKLISNYPYRIYSATGQKLKVVLGGNNFLVPLSKVSNFEERVANLNSNQ